MRRVGGASHSECQGMPVPECAVTPDLRTLAPKSIPGMLVATRARNKGGVDPPGVSTIILIAAEGHFGNLGPGHVSPAQGLRVAEAGVFIVGQ